MHRRAPSFPRELGLSPSERDFLPHWLGRFELVSLSSRGKEGLLATNDLSSRRLKGWRPLPGVSSRGMEGSRAGQRIPQRGFDGCAQRWKVSFHGMERSRKPAGLFHRGGNTPSDCDGPFSPRVKGCRNLNRLDPRGNEIRCKGWKAPQRGNQTLAECHRPSGARRKGLASFRASSRCGPDTLHRHATRNQDAAQGDARRRRRLRRRGRGVQT